MNEQRCHRDYVDVTCQGCQQEWAFTKEELAQLRADRQIGESDEVDVVSCPKCNTDVCAECTHEAHA